MSFPPVLSPSALEEDRLTTSTVAGSESGVTTVSLGVIPFEDPAFPDIEFEVLTNDGSDNSIVKLMALKNIFSRQLPKMPKDYIVRLVFDHRHFSLAIKRRGEQGAVIGGICYRPYHEQRFAEIAFCAISGTEQVRGFGTLLMNQLKAFVQPQHLEYFLTYADNFAIGYFQKQGFSKSITMPKERWVGYIKDYDGGTLMECYIHPNVPYLHVRDMVRRQRTFILSRIAAAEKESEKVFDGLECFKLGKRLSSVLEVPGVEAAGWTSSHIYRYVGDRDRTSAQSRVHASLKVLFEKLKNYKHFKALAFFPAPAGVLDRQRVIEQLRSGDYYRSKEALGADLLRMVDKAREYVPATVEHLEMLKELHSFVQDLFFPKDNTTTTTGE